MDWTETPDFDDYDKTIKLAEHLHVSKPSLLRTELQKAVASKAVPRKLRTDPGRPPQLPRT